jgi:hypothetical protein
MNLLECYIEKIFEERDLTDEEKLDWSQYSKVDPDDLIFVRWKYNCYGSYSIASDYMLKTTWEEIKKKGYNLR